MRSHRLSGAVLLATFALVAVWSSSAYALPEFLFTEGKAGAFTIKSAGAAVIENSAGSKIECSSATGSGGPETDTLGTLHIDFEKCKSEGFACNTESDPAEVILSEGSYHYVYDVLGVKDEQEGGSLGIAVLVLYKEGAFGCAGGLIKNKTKGTLLCLILKPLTSSIIHEVHCLFGKNKGEAGDRTYWNDNGTAVTAQLLASLNGGEFKEASMLWLWFLIQAQAGAWMNE